MAGDSHLDRRSHQRLELTSTTIAVDSEGRLLGRISHAGGGGMQIEPKPGVAELLPNGTVLRVTVMEPDSQTSHVIDVVVRYNDGKSIGVEFVTGKDLP
jgi:hypothetical protein